MQTFTLLSVREGQLKDDDNQTVDFANLKILEDRMVEQDGFVGIQVGKFKIVNRELASQIITQVKAAGKLPLKIDLDFDFNVKSGEKVELIVKDFKLKLNSKPEA